MTIGRHHSGELVGAEMPRKEQCKPDYESMIKRANEKKTEIAKALNGLLEAHEADVYIPGELNLIQAVGFLVLQKEEIIKALAKLIAEQEAENA